MNKQQVLRELKSMLHFMKMDDYFAASALSEVIAGIESNDTHNGFSNRETWAAYVHITNTPSWLADLYDKETGDGIKVWFDNCFEELLAMGDEDTVRAALDIGSLWRVNWDEVAAALKGEGDE